ncbi:MAG: SDR family oxidoreductase [Hyphomicrobiales bacterium]|nr:SDR family oxidoreductase [Hyphomicrobiales bacterium]MCP5000827.1 SDR family oxidoreductase [Hyphomicrobiales bacterium]
MKALVTGAASGLGLALVERLCAQGADVVAIDRNLIPSNDGVTALTVDLSDRDAVDQLNVELCAMGPFDFVVHNAGISATGRFEEIPEQAYQKLLAVNCETPMVMTSALLQAGSLAPRAHVLFISSISHQTGYPGASVYAASKDALAVYAKSIRRDCSRQDIHVMTVFPGPVRTDHAERHAPAGANAERRMEPTVLARKIVRAALRRRKTFYPEPQAKIGGFLGTLMPRATTRFMRRTIFEKLDRTVY